MAHERLFAVSAVLVSIIFGIRGIAIQVHAVENENIRLRDRGEIEWNKGQRWLVHYFQDFIYNFVGSLTGWISLYVLCRLKSASVYGVAFSLATVALLGIVGKLPQTVEGFILSIGMAVQAITGRIAPK